VAKGPERWLGRRVVHTCQNLVSLSRAHLSVNWQSAPEWACCVLFGHPVGQLIDSAAEGTAINRQHDPGDIARGIGGKKNGCPTKGI
jgi:hypothetical protein